MTAFHLPGPLLVFEYLLSEALVFKDRIASCAVLYVRVRVCVLVLWKYVYVSVFLYVCACI